MTLSPNGKALLDAVAKAIAFDSASGVDLFPLTRERNSFSDIPEYLAEQVEMISQKRFTVRVADTAFFADQVMGINHYLVRCSINTPAGVVTELTSDMILVSVGPYSNGFTMPARTASPIKVAEYRAFVAKSNIERAERERLEKAAKIEVDAAMDKLREKMELLLTSEERSGIYLGDDPTISRIAQTCQKLGIALSELFL